jgi:hypothetical protein
MKPPRLQEPTEQFVEMCDRNTSLQVLYVLVMTESNQAREARDSSSEISSVQNKWEGAVIKCVPRK